ncbi:MAG: DUF1016 N-terminal domain-containing protein [Bacillales bacterium]|nr:DUF1016 N-terminal domain-containing protein [Bacillales bacterium]
MKPSKVNEEMVLMYRDIGEYISKQSEKAEYGDSFVQKLADSFAANYPDLKGFNRRGLYRMRQFCELYKDNEKVPPLVTQLSWTNHLKIMSACKSMEERIFYMNSSLLISTIEACTQAENETRSDNIKWDIKQRASNGSLGFYRRKCYGYDKDENGDLVINKEQAEIFKLIFDLYLGGKSILGIVKELKERSIKSPTGKENWPKRSIEEMLRNEKYIVVSVVNVGGEEGQIYKLNNSHPAIISKEMFDVVQEEKLKRSNVELTDVVMKRKSNKYSSKHGGNR